MQIDRLVKHAIAGKQKCYMQHTSSQGKFNGLLLHSNMMLSGNITIKLRATNEEVRVLANRVPLELFQQLSDLNQGSFSINLDEGKLSSCMIPLGNVYLGPDCELDLEIEAGGRQTEETEILEVYTYQSQMSTFELLQYDISNDMEKHLSMLDAIYLIRKVQGDKSGLPEGVAIGKEETNIQIDFPHDKSNIFTSTAAAALTLAVSEVEKNDFSNGVPLVLLYANDSKMPKSNYIKVMGTNAAYHSLFTISRIYSSKQTSKNTIAEAKQEVMETAELEKNNPEAAKALRHGGKAVKSADLLEVVNAVENKKDIREDEVVVKEAV